MTASDEETSSAGEGALAMPGSEKPSKNTEWDAPWIEQRECFLLLLKARMLFRKLLEVKLYEERVTKGALSAIEVRNLVRSQQEDDSTDFVRQITELKRNLMTEIRKNYELEKEVTTLDKKIGLLIHNASAMQQLLQKKRRRVREGTAPSSAIPAERLHTYSNLFYLLQSEPSYLARLVGHMGEEAEGVEALLDTILITLYGDAFSPREEYLILTFFRLTVEQELRELQSTSGFGPDSLLAKAVLAYNRRKQGQEYLRSALGPVMLQFTGQVRKLRMDGRKIHEEIINEWEVQHGEKSNKRNLNDEEIAVLPEVVEALKNKVVEITTMCQAFLDAILTTTQRVPYGLRYIIRQLCQLAQERFPKAKQEEIYKMASYLIYYRFINLAIVQPDNFKIPVKNNDPNTTMSLVEVSKVLHKLFTFSQFDKRTERWYLPLNDWIQTHMGLVRRYLDEVIAVDNPEDVLQVDRYIELTQMVKPTILIAIHELSNMHHLLEQNIKEIAPADDDKLRVILKELGAAEDYADEDKVISLTLENKFPRLGEDTVNEGSQLFFQTKTMLISVLRQLPQSLNIAPSGAEPTLMDILKAGLKWAKDEGNETMRVNIETVRTNIETLEKNGVVSSEDGHRALLRAITLEIANRAQIREQQNKELVRLNAALRAAIKQQQYLTDQQQQYNQYIVVCREHHYTKPKAKKKKKKLADGKILGPFKYSYSELVRKHVIADSSIPDLVRKAMKLLITSSEPGVFDIEVKIPAVDAASLRIDLDELLELQSKSQEHVKHTVENAELTLDVNMTIHFLNTLLAKK
eukprot:m51a1_g7343 putative ase-activating protein (804) ;mRNA; r:214921-217709